MDLGIYVHLPFCPYICPYCDFAKWPHRASQAHRYLAALEREIRSYPSEIAQTLYLGGGTPNTYAAAEIASLVTLIGERFPCAPGTVREATIELNPELVDRESIDVYYDAGINRVSLGVQSLDPEQIHVLGRRHTPADVQDAVSAARAGGMSVSIDLIFGAPGATKSTWRATLEAAIALQPDHISTYGLTVEENTPYARWFQNDPDAFIGNDAEADLYAEAIDTLAAAGFDHYEISNFAKPGHVCKHNENYWANGRYHGLGVGAASYDGRERCVATRDLDRYVSAIENGTPIPRDCERLEADAAAGEAIMLALRTAQGVGLNAFKTRYGIDLTERYGTLIAEFVAAGLLDASNDTLRLTRRGRFIANDVCGAFLPFE